MESLSRRRPEKAQGGTVTLKLTDRPVATRYLRIWMTESSNTATNMDRRTFATALVMRFSRSPRARSTMAVP